MSDESNIRDSITFRYNYCKAKMQFLETSLQEISQMIKLKNPSLNLQIEKIIKNPSFKNPFSINKTNQNSSKLSKSI